jgi:hypothetical protein
MTLPRPDWTRSPWLRRIGFVALFLFIPWAATTTRSLIPDAYRDEANTIAIVILVGFLLAAVIKERGAIAQNIRRIWREI